MDVAAAHDVGADGLPVPAVDLRLADGVALRLGSLLEVFPRPAVLVIGLEIFPKADAAALGIGDLAVLDDPALGPVRAYGALLIGGRRRPLRRGLTDHEAGDGDVVHAGLFRIEAVAAHVDLHVFRIRIRALEIRVQYRLAAVLLRVPAQVSALRIPRIFKRLSLQNLLKLVRLVHGLPVEIDFTGMQGGLAVIPVAAKLRRIGIVGAENAVGDAGDPHVPLIRLPGFHLLRAGDHSLAGLFRAVGDPGILLAGADGVDPFAVKPRRDDHFIAGTRSRSRLLDALIRALPGTVPVSRSLCGHVILHVKLLLVNPHFPVIAGFSILHNYIKKCPARQGAPSYGQSGAMQESASLRCARSSSCASRTGTALNRTRLPGRSCAAAGRSAVITWAILA